MNVLIGRNNAGKSSILLAIENSLGYLKSGRVSSIWQTKTPAHDLFTNRLTTTPAQIGLTFDIPPELNDELRQMLLESSSGLDVAIGQLRQINSASVIFAITLHANEAVIYAQELGIGTINASGETLKLSGSKLLALSSQAAIGFTEREREIEKLRRQIEALDRLDPNVAEFAFRDGPSTARGRTLREMGLLRDLGSSETYAKLESLLSSSTNSNDFKTGIAQLKASIETDIDELEHADTQEAFQVFSGQVRQVPTYIPWLLERLGEGTVLSFKEVRPAIGRDEATQLLRLKTKRGGAEALARIQQTVKQLLGVEVDAFEPESAPNLRRTPQSAPEAEMDIDEFLVEVNGAGIREALRIILDLELRDPSIAIIEEPEVHLHPGLERVLHQYLVQKSRAIQLFIATHSANFLDRSNRQNVYLLTRIGRDAPMNQTQVPFQ